MKRFNFNIKDRKVLTLGLCLVLVCVFTLSIAYAALSVTLNIQGSAQVSSADWNIHFANPIVTNGSATTDVPSLVSATTVDFNTTLNLPGDFYEFTIDVVNGGSIDAVIEGVTKTPELTDEQAKYLKYEVIYNDGSSINSSRNLLKDSTDTIKVRIEYRKDISNSDLPTGQVVLDLSLTLNYIQSDGSSDDGGSSDSLSIINVNGDINDIGTIVDIGDEQFYVIGEEGNDVKLLAMYNLDAGYYVSKWPSNGFTNPEVSPLPNPTGIQDKTSGGGVLPFIPMDYMGDNYSDYNDSLVKIYTDEYKTYLESFDIVISEARAITYEEVSNPDTFACNEDNCSSKYPWINTSNYWTGTAVDEFTVYAVLDCVYGYDVILDFEVGVRPVILISKDYF